MKAALVTAAALALLASHSAFAQSDADFAGGLEEALGHFKALEDNLDENNAELALVHATHPIEELYEAMKPQLASADPSLDARVQAALQQLGRDTGSGVSRAQAQAAIDAAKEIIEVARTAVVGSDLSADPAFKIDLAKGLLETSIAEYGEAVEDGAITNMPEFQDGSAFVWRAEQITMTLGSEGEGLSEAYDRVNAAYARTASPAEVESATNDLMDDLDGINQSRIDFAGGLEEALGHFKALEDNLREGNADLALVHATHPIEELYEAMKPQLAAADPALDSQVLAVLKQLGRDTGSSVSRTDAQSAVNAAKGVVETARTTVVGDYLSEKPDTKLKLMRGLLETSVAEYGEAVENGAITNMPEFQDGSAFVWRAEQILAGIPDAPEMASEFAAVKAAYEQRVDPSEVEALTAKITDKIDSVVGSSETSLSEYISNMRSMLGQARSEYAAGNTDNALSLATRAYLDNYEFLEGPLLQSGQGDLMGEVEVMLREELRSMIRNGSPASSVNSQINAVLSGIDRVEAALAPSGAMAMVSGQDAADFAGGLEEALGHFKALEDNLDDGDADSALIHATHPIAELYDAMKPQLVSADPSLDARVQSALQQLGRDTGPGVSRAQAQSAIDAAKDVVEVARTAVVGDELSADPAFKIDLAKGLLVTSIAEYGEAVENGTIVNLPEFQDGSAFVWRAEQITMTLGSEGEGLSNAYDRVNAAYARTDSPAAVESATNDLMDQLDALHQNRIDFAGGLEEALGHFKALEDNLDDGDANSALIHATHPIAELYESMKPQLAAADPALDRSVQTALNQLGDRTGPDVSRADAQAAIDAAKDVVETARTTVVGDYLSEKPDTKLKLMRGLLETSVAEYGEAVENGAITNMPEFQDGSAFVWRAEQILAGIPDAPAMDSDFAAVKAAYEQRVDPSEVEALTAKITDKIDSVVGSSETSLSEYISNIRDMLEQARSEYARGNGADALSLATKAYLDNYEFLEAPLIQAGERELMEEVEIMIREELRSAIRNGSPAASISSQIDTVLSKMNDVEAALAPSGAMAMVSGQDAADFAGGLEEALGHFKALEDNLDDGDADSALIHATHPIAELYDAMKPQLVSADPSLDARVQSALQQLGRDTGPSVSRAQAQSAIDAAKEVIEVARTSVVGPDLSADAAFKIDLAKGLLMTSIAEYGEAVENGTIVNLPEFQDGSAFVWRAEQITMTLGSEGEGLSNAYDAVNAAYARIASPAAVESATNDLMAELDAIQQSKIDFAGGLEEALGHFKALEDNLDDGDADSALIHATHPIAELYDSMKPQLASADRSLDSRVQTVLNQLGDRTSPDVSRADAQAAIDAAKDVVEAARAAVVGDYLSEKSETKLILMRGLLETSVAEYGEAVENGAITNLPEFQDGSAFVWRAEQILAGIPDAPAMSSDFAAVKAAYEQRVDPSEVADLTARITDRIDSVVGSSQTDLLDYVANIRTMLEQARTEYAGGNTDEALSLATKAYLDNYEFLEAPLIQAGERELMEDVEIMMREELRSMIREGAPADEVSSQIDMILIRMDTVAQIVPEFGVMAALVMASATAAAVGIGARRRF